MLRYSKLLKSLKNSLVISFTEVIYIRQAYEVFSFRYFKYKNSHYTEIQLLVDATSYLETKDGNLIKEDINEIMITINMTTQIIKLTEDNIGLLLLDNCRVVREAATQIYKKTINY